MPKLPALPLWLPGLLLALAWARWGNAPWRGMLLIALLGALWGCWHAQLLLEQVTSFSARPVRAQVQITSVRFSERPEARMVVRLIRVNQRWVFPPLYAQLEGAPAAMASWCGGQQWLVTLRLRAVHSRLNEGGFDRQRWAVAKRQPLNGRIVSAAPLDAECGARQQLVSELEAQTRARPWQAIIIALAVGEMSLVSEETMLLLRQTGTLHLMAISGLHIALAALFGWGLARGVQYGLRTHRIGYRFPLLAGVATAWGYVWLAGGNPPAVRAALALTVWALLRLRGVRCSPWQVWLWCVALILMCDPLGVLSDSFWLSCLAVASLIFWYQWAPLPAAMQRRKRWVWLRWLHLQTGMTLLLMPLQIALFHGASLTSLPANLWAVPLVSLVTTPLILLGLPLLGVPWLSQPLWWLADRSLALVFAPLAAMPDGWLPLGEASLPFGLLGWAAVVAWRFAWWRAYPLSLGALLLIVLLWPKAPEPLWRLDMLDVGHGLAVVIEQRGEAVLYDTGNRWEGGDMASREIIPYLRWRGLRLERIIVSHSHLDHIGGLRALQAAYPQTPVFSTLLGERHQPCRQGQRWRWRNLTFSVLWPPAPAWRAGNNHSCVIRIDDGRYRVLLTGDIEKAAEAALVREQRQALAADVLLAPHHGSNTSSSPPFLRVVGPVWGLSSNSRYNPWRLPAAKIRQRYRQAGVVWLDTARHGQLSVRFFTDSAQVLRYREELAPRWYHGWFGADREK